MGRQHTVNERVTLSLIFHDLLTTWCFCVCLLWHFHTRAEHATLTVTPTKSPELWIELKEKAVALFKYPVQC